MLIKNFPSHDFILESQVDLEPYPYPLTAEDIQRDFLPPPAGIGPPHKLTLMTVDSVVEGFGREALKILSANVGELEFAVAGIVLWYHLVPREVREWLREHPLHRVPISKIRTPAGAAWLDSLRSTASVGGPNGHTVFLHLRKYKSLLGRAVEQADWVEEQHKRTNTAIFREWVYRDGRRSHARWLQEVMRAIDEITEEIVMDVAQSAHPQSLFDWWQQRSLWMPAGSSSERHRLDEVRRGCKHLDTSDRPNKRSVAETMTYQELVSHMIGRPVAFARVSTKYEPGYKQRPLYASDDWSTLIASYASQDVEKAMCIGGMVAKQAPADVVEWMRQGMIGAREHDTVWLSMDFSDFNMEHTYLVMEYLNLAFARAWLRRRHLGYIALQKAYACWWVARSHQNAWIHYPHATVRGFHGLWSGHRNTARDNTILHLAYNRVIERMVLEATGVRVVPPYKAICGDDEDARFNSLENMALYLLGHIMAGHEISKPKQQIGRATHEFLQRQAGCSVVPARPICATIATFASGNWYKDFGHHFDSAIQSFSDYGWEVVSRGGNRLIMMRLVRKVLDRYFTVAITQDGVTRTVKFSWWPWRHAGKLHQLWKDTPGDVGRPLPELRKVEYPLLSPRAATNDLKSYCWHWVSKLAPEMQVLWTRCRVREAHKAFFGLYGEQQRKINALDDWPRRSAKTPKIRLMWAPQITRPTSVEALRTLNPSGGERRPPTLDGALRRMRLDTFTFEKLGGWQGVLRYGKPGDMAHYIHEYVYDEGAIPRWAYNEDPAILSWLRSRNN